MATNDGIMKNVLAAIEKIIGKSIPEVNNVENCRIGFNRDGKKIVGLTLNYTELKSVPELIKQLNSLEILDLSFNQLEKIPDWITDLPLTSLNITSNKVSNLPKKIGTISTLKYLKLIKNPLKRLPNTLRRFSDIYSNFKELWVSEYGWDASSRETLKLLKERRVRIIGPK